MKIDLEKYIRSNRDHLDVEEFDVEKMWNDFDQKNRTVPVRRIKPWFLMVAAVAIVLIGVAVFFNNENVINQDDLVYQRLTEIDPDLAAEQVSMLHMISEQDSLIKNLGITESQFPDLFQEIQILDSLQVGYIKDLKNYRDRKNLTRTLLRHYQRKTRVLELMLYEFEKQEIEIAHEKDTEI